jgi:hypothetical protein
MPGVHQRSLDRYAATQLAEIYGWTGSTAKPVTKQESWERIRVDFSPMKIAPGGHMHRKYCKAYYLRDLRQFSDWMEKSEADEPALSDDDVVYLWDDFTVIRNAVIPDKGMVFDAVTPEWQNFCATTLHFEIPEDLRYAYEQQEPETSEAAG